MYVCMYACMLYICVYVCMCVRSGRQAVTPRVRPSATGAAAYRGAGRGGDPDTPAFSTGVWAAGRVWVCVCVCLTYPLLSVGKSHLCKPRCISLSLGPFYFNTIHTYMHAYIHTYIHTYIRIHIHIHTHTYAHKVVASYTVGVPLWSAEWSACSPTTLSVST